jgi:hypothetical protein
MLSDCRLGVLRLQAIGWQTAKSTTCLCENLLTGPAALFLALTTIISPKNPTVNHPGSVKRAESFPCPIERVRVSPRY